MSRRTLALPEFRRLWSSHTVSLFGDQISTLALPLTAVLLLHAGPSAMGLLTAAGLLPSLLLSLHAGSFSDRYGHRRRTMVIADVGRAVLLLSVPVTAAFGMLSLAQLYAVAFATGTLSVFFAVASSSLFTAVVPNREYVAANSLLHGSRAFSFLAGPSLGGLLVQAITAPFAVLVDAVSFLVSAAFLGRIRAVEPPTELPGRAGTTAGLRFLRRSPSMRALLASTTTLNLFNFMFVALFTLYATRTLGIRPGTLGLVLGAGAVGSLLGSVMTSRISGRIGIGPTFLLGMVLFPAPLLLVPLATGPGTGALILVFVAEFGSGTGVMMLDIASGSIMAATVPPQLRARVSGAYRAVNYGIRPLGSLLGGALGSLLGLREALWIATAGAITGVLWAMPGPLRRMRVLPEMPEEEAATAASAAR
ncbi:MAG: MFS transporter [Actinocatenispora sp.]